MTMWSLELLKAAARQRLAAGQGELDVGLEATVPARRSAGGGPLPITATRMGVLLDALEHAYRVLGFDEAAGPHTVTAADPIPTISAKTRSTTKLTLRTSLAEVRAAVGNCRLVLQQ